MRVNTGAVISTLILWASLLLPWMSKTLEMFGFKNTIVSSGLYFPMGKISLLMALFCLILSARSSIWALVPALFTLMAPILQLIFAGKELKFGLAWGAGLTMIASLALIVFILVGYVRAQNRR